MPLKKLWFLPGWFLCSLLSNLSGIVAAQPPPPRLYDPRKFSLIDLSDHLELNFKWTMDGQAQAAMNEGLSELRERHFTTAISNFDQVLKHDSTFWPARYYRAVCHKNQGQIVTAEVELLRTIREYSASPEPFIELGEIYHVKKLPQKAYKHYKTAIELSPNFVPAIYAYGCYYLTMSDINRALKLYTKCTEIDPGFAQAFFVQGMLKLSQLERDSKGALSYMNKAIEADSQYTAAKFIRGLIYAEDQKNELVLKDWSDVIAADPTNRFYHLMRGVLYIELEKYDDAFVDFRKALEKPSTLADEYTGRETIMDKRADLRKTAEYLMVKGYGLPEENFSLIKKAFCLALTSKDDEALMFVNEAIQRQQSSGAYLLKGVILNSQKKIDSAVVYYGRALRLDRDIFEAYEKRALYYFYIKNWKAAYADVLEMRRLQPDAPVIIRFSGMIKSSAKDYYGCLLDLGRFVKTDSTDINAWFEKAKCHSKVGDYANAIHDFKRCIELDDLNRDMYAWLYDTYVLNKDSVEAFKTLRRMNKKWPLDLTTRLAIAVDFMKMGQPDSSSYVLENIEIDMRKLRQSGVPRDDKFESDVFFLHARNKEIQKLTSESLSLLNHAVRLDPENDEKVFFRVNVNLKLGRTIEARRDLEKLKLHKYKPAEYLYNLYVK